MANARLSALMSRRSGGLYNSTGGVRVLAPASTGISSLAKQSASNELDIMIAKYNAGLIGNTEMKSFLQTQLTSPYVSTSDKTQIQTKLLDFDALIEKDRLESVFKQAPENSLERIQAATALADFYTKRANSMVAGTQAQSQALENAGQWQTQVVNIQQSVNKEQRKNFQYSMLTKINGMENSSSAKSEARAQMYQKLYDMAVSQGDTEDAQVYAANRATELANAQAYRETEGRQAESAKRKEIINEFNIVKNAYWTGQISYEEYKNFLTGLNNYAMENQDGTLQNTVSTEAAAMEKQQVKGGVNAKDLGGGLFTRGKGKGVGSGGSGGTAADKMTQAYSDDLRIIQEMYVRGVDGNGNPYGEKEYKEDLTEAVNNRVGNLEAFYNEAQRLASENPTARIEWKGSKRKAIDVIDEIEKEYNNVYGLDTAIENGSAVLVGLPPGDKPGKNIATYELRDSRFFNDQEQELLKPDDSGILWQGEMAKTKLVGDALKEYESAKELGGSSFNSDEYYKDNKTGAVYKYEGLRWNVVDPVSGQVYNQKIGPDGKLVSAATVRSEVAGLRGKAVKDLNDEDLKGVIVDPEYAKMINETQQRTSPEQLAKSQERKKKLAEAQAVKSIEVPNPMSKEPQKPITTLPLAPMVSKESPATAQLKSNVPAISTQAPRTLDLSQGIQSIPNPIVPKPVPTPTQPQSQPQPVQIQPGLSTYNPPKQTVSITQLTPMNTQQAVQSGGLKINYTPPPVTKAPQPTTLQKIGTAITTTASNAWNKLKGWLGF